MLGKLFKKAAAASLSLQMRDTLYDDLPMEKFPPGPNEAFPWSKFVKARDLIATGRIDMAIDCWREITELPGLDPRFYAQAWHYLRAQGVTPPPERAKQILGVIIELGMAKGLDLLAAYPDYSARYYNYSSAGAIWEHPDNSLNPIINALFAASARAVAHLGPWTESRPGPPPTDQVRLSFLTPSGLHFGQGPIKAMSADSIGGPVFHLGAELMRALIQKTMNAKKQAAPGKSQ